MSSGRVCPSQLHEPSQRTSAVRPSSPEVPRSAVSFGSALDSLLREGDTEERRAGCGARVAGREGKAGSPDVWQGNKLVVTKYIASSKKCHTSRNKKLLETTCLVWFFNRSSFTFPWMLVPGSHRPRTAIADRRCSAKKPGLGGV